MKYITKDKDFYKTFARLTSVIALQNIIVYAVNLADNIMLGSYAESAMSGVALVNQIQFLLQMVIVGVGEGVVILGFDRFEMRFPDRGCDMGCRIFLPRTGLFSFE